METWQNTEGLAFWIWFIICVFIGLILLIVYILKTSFNSMLQKERELKNSIIEHQKELLKTSILTQEKERSRIAQDIHDGLVLQLNVIRLSKKTDEKVVNQKLKECIKMVRLISHDLMPPLIEETPLEDILSKLIYDLEDDKEVNINTSIFKHSEMNADAKLQLIRIVQEVVNNILKHAEASKVEFLLRITPNMVALKIEDNGKGFNKTKSNGLGLNNIIARTQLLKGQHIFKSVPGRGTRFLLRIPIKQNIKYGKSQQDHSTSNGG